MKLLTQCQKFAWQERAVPWSKSWPTIKAHPGEHIVVKCCSNTVNNDNDIHQKFNSHTATMVMMTCHYILTYHTCR